jgi:hypothetical protein
VPYLSGKPSGTARNIPVLWKDEILFVAKQSAARMAKVVPAELAQTFQNIEINDAIKTCYDRSENFVAEYLEENFKLVPADELFEEGGNQNTGAGVKPPQNPLSDSKGGQPYDGSQQADDEGGPGDGRDADKSDEYTSEGEMSDGTEQGPDDQHPEPKPLRPPKPSKPSLIDLFARKRGFSKDGSDRYYRADGSWLERTHGNGFHWEQHSRSGDLIQYYWCKDHCIEQEPLQLDAAIWGLCEKFPDLYSIVLVDHTGEPEEIPGHSLVSMRKEGNLELHPATYRLVYIDGH